MLPFLKNVLNSNYANEKLDLKPFDLTKALESETFKDFELELEKSLLRLAAYLRSKRKS